MDKKLTLDSDTSMTPHTNQVVPVVRGVGRDIDNPKSLRLYFDRELSDDELIIVHETLKRAAAPQQQGEPVAHVGHRSTYGIEWNTEELPPEGTPLFTQPLTADSSFNQGVELAIGRALYKIRQYLKEKHPAVDSWDMSCAVNEFAGAAKRPTDMVTMARDKFETHIAAAIGIGLAEAQNRVAGNVGNALDEAKAYVSRALKEGK